MFTQALLAGRKTWKVLKISFWALEGILVQGTAILAWGYSRAVAGPAALHEDDNGLLG
jgi:hypothetical protein